MVSELSWGRYLPIEDVPDLAFVELLARPNSGAPSSTRLPDDPYQWFLSLTEMLGLDASTASGAAESQQFTGLWGINEADWDIQGDGRLRLNIQVSVDGVVTAPHFVTAFLLSVSQVLLRTPFCVIDELLLQLPPGACTTGLGGAMSMAGWNEGAGDTSSLTRFELRLDDAEGASITSLAARARTVYANRASGQLALVDAPGCDLAVETIADLRFISPLLNLWMQCLDHSGAVRVSLASAR